MLSKIGEEKKEISGHVDHVAGTPPRNIYDLIPFT